MFRSAGNPVVSRPRTHGRHPSARVPCASSRRSSCAPRTGGSQQGRASAQGWSRLVHKTQQGAHFLEREPELPRPQHESKPPLMHRVIASVPVGCPRRRRQETDLFIIAHGFEVGARPPGQFGPPIDAFRADDTRGKHAACANHVLRVQLRQVGRLGDRFSEVRDGLQGLGRIVAYTDQYACEWSGGALKPRLAGLRGDIHSLIEYEEQLSRHNDPVPVAGRGTRAHRARRGPTTIWRRSRSSAGRYRATR
jgi:hypothetical protein